MATEHRTFCRICISACGMIATVEGNEVVAVGGDASHPLTRGYLCPKGRALGAFHHAEGRLDGGLIGRDEGRRIVDVDECHADLQGTLTRVVESYGMESVGVFLGTGVFLDPAAAWASRRLLKALGTPYAYSTATVDAVAKTLVAEQMAGTSLLIPNIDEQHGRLLLFVGMNPVVSHGHSTMYSNPVDRIRAAKQRGPVFVLDPRVTETARLADHHLAARAGTDYAVFAYVIRALMDAGLDDALAERATGMDGLRAAVAPFDRDSVAAFTGLEAGQLDGLVGAIQTAGRLAILTGTGSTMSVPGNLTEWLAWSLMVLTDSFDQPGGMWFNPGLFTRLDRFDVLPPVGQPAPGPPSRPDIPRCGGEWPASLIPDEIEAGRLRALFVLGGNLITALPNPERVERALRNIDALVVLDIQRTATTDVATHVFACADQLERPDTLPLELNANAVYQQYTDAVVEAPASRPPMWRTIANIGRGLGLDLLGSGADPNEVATEAVLARVARRVPLETLRQSDDVYIEAPAAYGWVTPRLPLGKWNLAPQPLVDQLATMAAPAPLVLTPRRPVRRMNTQHYRAGDHPEALIHPKDAAAASIVDGQLVEVSSASGSIRLPARVTTAIAAGAVSIQHGWVDCNVNQLIDPHDLDPLTGMAHLSGTAVTLRPAGS